MVFSMSGFFLSLSLPKLMSFSKKPPFCLALFYDSRVHSKLSAEHIAVSLVNICSDYGDTWVQGIGMLMFN